MIKLLKMLNIKESIKCILNQQCFYLLFLNSYIYAQSSRIPVEIIVRSEDIITRELSFEIKRNIKESNFLTLDTQSEAFLKMIVYLKIAAPLPVDTDRSNYALVASVTMIFKKDNSRYYSNSPPPYYVDTYVVPIIPEVVKKVASTIVINIDEIICEAKKKGFF